MGEKTTVTQELRRPMARWGVVAALSVTAFTGCGESGSSPGSDRNEGENVEQVDPSPIEDFNNPDPQRVKSLEEIWDRWLECSESLGGDDTPADFVKCDTERDQALEELENSSTP